MATRRAQSKDRSGQPSRGGPASAKKAARKEYKKTLHALRVELVKLQRCFIECDGKIAVVIEGRDAAGKDGVIKRIVKNLSPRETRVVALGKPSDRDRTAWYFQRYAPHLPAAQEMVLFDRSWYNRAGVERVMGFCTDAEYEEFIGSVLEFEHMVVRSGVKLFKYWLDISKHEQKKRLEDRRRDPLKQWKISPIDACALEKWNEYGAARDEMFKRTHNPITPWTIVRADDKRAARINVIKDLLSRLDYERKNRALLHADPQIVFPYADDFLANGMIAS